MRKPNKRELDPDIEEFLAGLSDCSMEGVNAIIKEEAERAALQKALGGQVTSPLALIKIAVAVALTLQEWDRTKAMEEQPEHELLMERLRARTGELDLLVGVVSAYLVKPQAPRRRTKYTKV